jgi:hypothetical protein
LKSLDNQADFDSAIPRFESWRPSQPIPCAGKWLDARSAALKTLILLAISIRQS